MGVMQCPREQAEDVLARQVGCLVSACWPAVWPRPLGEPQLLCPFIARHVVANVSGIGEPRGRHCGNSAAVSTRPASVLRVGLVGAGRWGANYLRALPNTPGVRLDCVCDVDRGALDRAASIAPHVSTTGDIETLLALVDAVVVATPTASHAELALRILDAKKHVLVEKPLATDVASALAVIERAALREKALVVGHLTLLHPALARLRELLEAQAIGRLRRIEVTRSSTGAAHRRDSALWSLGPHDVANVLFVTGAVEASVRDAWESNEVAGIELDLRGVPVQMAWSRTATTPERRLSILGASGSLHFDEIRGALLLERAGVTTEVSAAGAHDLLGRQCLAFAEAAAGKPTVAGRAFQVVRVLEQAQARLDHAGAVQKLSAPL